MVSRIDKIGGAIRQEYDIIAPYRIEKGGGSAYGGKWRPNPNKPQDARYWGNPGEIKTTVMNNGDIFKTKIGNDGRAEIERHETDHNRSDKHTDPMTTKLIGITLMSILYLAHQSIILMSHRNLNNM